MTMLEYLVKRATELDIPESVFREAIERDKQREADAIMAAGLRKQLEHLWLSRGSAWLERLFDEYNQGA